MGVDIDILRFSETTIGAVVDKDLIDIFLFT
jgi:hypothetical protein